MCCPREPFFVLNAIVFNALHLVHVMPSKAIIVSNAQITTGAILLRFMMRIDCGSFWGGPIAQARCAQLTRCYPNVCSPIQPHFHASLARHLRPAIRKHPASQACISRAPACRCGFSPRSSAQSSTIPRPSTSKPDEGRPCCNSYWNDTTPGKSRWVPFWGP